MANKIKYGLSNVYYAGITYASDNTVTYGTPAPIQGAVSLSLEAQGDTNIFYADNIAYFTSTANNGYQGDLEVALLPDAFRTDILGETTDAKGFFVERSTDAAKEFALLFQFEGDDKAVKHCLYRCTAARPAAAGQTKEDSINPQTESLTITAMPRIKDQVVKSRCPSTATTSYSAWYTAVQEPTP